MANNDIPGHTYAQVLHRLDIMDRDLARLRDKVARLERLIDNNPRIPMKEGD